MTICTTELPFKVAPQPSPAESGKVAAITISGAPPQRAAAKSGGKPGFLADLQCRAKCLHAYAMVSIRVTS